MVIQRRRNAHCESWNHQADALRCADVKKNGRLATPRPSESKTIACRVFFLPKSCPFPPSVHDAWVRFVLTNTLEFDENLLAEGQVISQTFQVEVAEHGELLRPNIVLNDPATNKARIWAFLAGPY